MHEHESHVHRAAPAPPGQKRQENHQGMFPVANAALQSWIKGEKGFLKCCISVSHKPEGHLHETRGHKSSSQHGDEHDKGMMRMMIAKQQIKPLFWQNNAIFFFVFSVAKNLNKHVHEAHGHRTLSGHMEEETNVESKGTTVSIVVALFA